MHDKLKHAVVDKRIAGIIRWLERLKESYNSGSMESALMDAECAKADLENLTQDFWEKVKPAELQHRRKWSVILRPAFVAVLFLMMTVAPLARDVSLPLPEPLSVPVEEVVLAEPVVAVVAEQPEEVRTQAPAPAPKRAAKKAAAKRTPSAPAKTSQENTRVAKAKTVPYDKVFSLMQTGQRALKNNNSVVRMQ